MCLYYYRLSSVQPFGSCLQLRYVWVNLSAHSSCVLTRPCVCTTVAVHSTVYPVYYNCLVNKLVYTQFVFAYTVGRFTTIAAHSTVYPVCYHSLVNKLVCTLHVFAYTAVCLTPRSAQYCVSCLLSQSGE